MAFCDSSVKVISALLPSIFDMIEMADAKEFSINNHIQIEAALMIRSVCRLGEEQRGC